MQKNPYKLPLYVFATVKEFLGVFPECSAIEEIDGRLPTEVFMLPRNLGFACILEMGLMRYGLELYRTLASCREDNMDFDYVVLTGICGAYPDRGVNMLDVVRIDTDIEDVGYENADGTLGRFEKYKYILASNPKYAPPFIRDLKSVNGVTVNCCTGTLATAMARSKVFNADVETMEGVAGLIACNILGFRVYQVRAVSNIASTRDKSSWKIDEALAALRKTLLKV